MLYIYKYICGCKYLLVIVTGYAFTFIFFSNYLLHFAFPTLVSSFVLIESSSENHG